MFSFEIFLVFFFVGMGDLTSSSFSVSQRSGMELGEKSWPAMYPSRYRSCLSSMYSPLSLASYLIMKSSISFALSFSSSICVLNSSTYDWSLFWWYFWVSSKKPPFLKESYWLNRFLADIDDYANVDRFSLFVIFRSSLFECENPPLSEDCY